MNMKSNTDIDNRCKACFGIISYLPDDQQSISIRKARLEQFILQIKKLFSIPVIIIAQNWNNININLTDDCIIYHYKKLGILGARRELRTKFLESNFEYLIMADDDVELNGTEADAKAFLANLYDHPYGYTEYDENILNMFAISKFAYSKCDMPDIDPEKKEGFEDRAFLWLLRHTVRGVEFQIIGCNIRINCFSDDYISTWADETTKKDWKDMSDKTIKYFQKVADLCLQGKL